MAEYLLPSLGADMDTATLVEWRVHPGETVRKGQVVALIETTKSEMDIEFFEDAVIEEILVPVGRKVAVGTPIARYAPAGAPSVAPAPAPRAPAKVPPAVVPPGVVSPAAVSPAAVSPAAVSPAAVSPAAVSPAAVSPAAAPPTPAAAPRRPVRGDAHAHPAVRRLAARLGVDVEPLQGSGPDGTVTQADVRAAAGAIGKPAARAEVSPRARRLALEQGIDLTRLMGTGPGGVVTSSDVERFAAGPAAAAPEGPSVPEAIAAEPAPAPTEAERAAGRRQAMRTAIADLMTRSKREIPHYYLETNVDMGRALAWLEAANLERPMAGRLVPSVLVIKAVALAVHDVPEMNGFWVDGRFEPGPGVHTGVAISLREGGLIAPAIHDADQLDLAQLMAALRDLVDRTRRGVLHRAEMTDPTITITNLGEQGVASVFGVIYPPQVALVGFGRIMERPSVVEGTVIARPMASLTLSADHRNSDGHRGGLFLAAIERRLKEPDAL